MGNKAQILHLLKKTPPTMKCDDMSANVISLKISQINIYLPLEWKTIETIKIYLNNSGEITRRGNLCVQPT
jgi:hypothetical protein